MTTFEITIIVLLAVIVLLLVWRNIQAKKEIEGVTQNQVYNYTELRKIVVGIQEEIGQTNGRIDGFIPEFKKLLEHNESIENFWAADSGLVIKLLKELVDIEHKSDERNDNMFPFMQEIMRNYNPPCYAPDGICTNPQMDCINCPKRGTGGTWSTNIVKEE